MNSQSSWQRDFLLLFLAIGIFFCIGLGTRPYLTPSEARYIEVPRQMLANNDWLTPHLNGVPYFEKPPLFYWMQASVMQFFGSGEFAGRIVTTVLATLLCLVTYATGRLLHDRLSGLLAAAVLATCMLGYCLSRVAMLDTPVTLFLSSCLACFLAAQHSERKYYWGMYVAAALAVLTKGLIGMVIPGLVIGAWIVIAGRWRILKEARLFSGLVLFFAIAAPWHVLMAMKHPAFFDFYFIHEHFQRFLTDEAKRVQPWWFFISITIVGLLPWTFVTPHSLRVLLQLKNVSLKLRDDRIFLLLWIFLPLGFFSASHSKLAPYIFPIFPPLAIMLGHYLAECWHGRIKSAALRINSFIVAAIFAVIIIGYYIVPLPENPDGKLDFITGITPLMLLPIIVALAGLVYVALSKRAVPALICALVVFAAVVDISANAMVAAIDRATIKPLVAIVKGHLHDDDRVAAYGSYFQDLPIYLNQNIVVADYTGELEFGVAHYPETHGWMISAEQFWQLCAEDKLAYVFMKNTTYEGLTMPKNCRLRVAAKYGKTVLLEREAK